MKRPIPRSGFTLLEVVLSITLLALIALMVARIFSDSTRAVDQGKSLAMMDESARVILDLLERDISQALIRTNVPFRVETELDDEFSKLYFVSTGMRRQLETMPRDTAPMLIRIEKNVIWDQQLTIEAPYGSAGANNSNRRRLRGHSDYYFDTPSQAAGDFTTRSGSSMNTRVYNLTELLQSTSSDYAMLSSFSLVVNGDPDWTATPSGLPNTDDLPRFVDIRLGLTPSSIIRQARTLYLNANAATGYKLIWKHEQIFTRRIFFPNTGTDNLSL